ncbi:chlorite dismutase family protein [Rubrivirga marina]|uniref:Chlorite dismutase n=1 Tax=Rubrivirga marina TaxID=1196024 RepID=A0A271J0W8_9BACT|nr:chlorite dismutase family protein [Rubrivirga marina]PAP77142.1 hypothetical protein BSZ37_12240 [Rubrivirga marina]
MALDLTTPPPSAEPAERSGLDLAERGKTADGAPQSLDRRLLVQLHAYTGCADPARLGQAAEAAGVGGVVYQSAQDPQGVAVVTFSESDDFFVEAGRDLLLSEPFAALTPRPELTMFGRTYSIGYETDLLGALVARPVKTMTNPAWPWAVWYPLRRGGRFEREPREEQRRMLMEHGGIGRAFGESDLAHDVRLACHGMDENDSDFIAGLVGKDLYPLSKVVQRMRGTRHTAEFLERLGPFFVGRAVWQSAGPYAWALSHEGSGH